VDAIKLLSEQHREVEKMFEQFEKAGDGARKTKERLCRDIADALAVHATIEEKIFYPATKDARSEELLLEAVEEHLAAKRIISDLIEKDVDDEHLAARMSVLKEQIEHHVEEEEKELFPLAKKLLDKRELDELGTRMEQMAQQLEESGSPRMEVPGQTDEPAPI
jgi:hemerythrin-like domain-containing protein